MSLSGFVCLFSAFVCHLLELEKGSVKEAFR